MFTGRAMARGRDVVGKNMGGTCSRQRDNKNTKHSPIRTLISPARQATGHLRFEPRVSCFQGFGGDPPLSDVAGQRQNNAPTRFAFRGHFDSISNPGKRHSVGRRGPTGTPPTRSGGAVWAGKKKIGGPRGSRVAGTAKGVPGHRQKAGTVGAGKSGFYRPICSARCNGESRARAGQCEGRAGIFQRCFRRETTFRLRGGICAGRPARDLTKRDLPFVIEREGHETGLCTGPANTRNGLDWEGGGPAPEKRGGEKTSTPPTGGSARQTLVRGINKNAGGGGENTQPNHNTHKTKPNPTPTPTTRAAFIREVYGGDLDSGTLRGCGTVRPHTLSEQSVFTSFFFSWGGGGPPQGSRRGKVGPGKRHGFFRPVVPGPMADSANTPFLWPHAHSRPRVCSFYGPVVSPAQSHQRDQGEAGRFAQRGMSLFLQSIQVAAAAVRGLATRTKPPKETRGSAWLSGR